MRHNPPRAENGRYAFVTDCVHSTYGDMRDMLDDHPVVAVSMSTFKKAIGLEAWKDLTAQLGYRRDFPISKDWHVGYYKATYRGVPAYFLRHSGIEHIYTLDGKVGPSLSTRENPYRKVAGRETRTWLPEDAGQFSKGNPDHNVIGWKPAPRRKALGHPEGAFFHIGPSKPKLILPDGREVAVEKLGKGHWTTAYLGDDGWVYLRTAQKGLRDPAKDVLVFTTEDAKREPWAVHLPWIEYIGWLGDTDKVYRMPLYEKIPAGSKNAKLARKLAEVRKDAFAKTGRPGAFRPIPDVKWATVELAEERIGGTLAQALYYLASVLEDWGYGWNFEFPRRNLMQDADGNLVLLDVIFDEAALQDERIQARLAQARLERRMRRRQRKQ